MSSSGKGQLWVSVTNGNLRRWTGQDLDSVDWSTNPTITKDQFDCSRATLDGVSVASNGDVCFKQQVKDGDACASQEECGLDSFCGTMHESCHPEHNKCAPIRPSGGCHCDLACPGNSGSTGVADSDLICNSGCCDDDNGQPSTPHWCRSSCSAPASRRTETVGQVWCKRLKSDGSCEQAVRANPSQMPSSVKSVDIGASWEHMCVVDTSGVMERRQANFESLPATANTAPSRCLDASITKDGWLWCIDGNGKVWNGPLDGSADFAEKEGSATPTKKLRVSMRPMPGAF